MPGIFAAGDICEYDSVVHGRPLRVEHWDVAFNQGKTAALNMLGQRRRPRRRALLLLRPRRLGLDGVRRTRPGHPVIRGSLDDGDFTAFYVGEDGAVTAALTVGRSDDLEHARRFIKEKSAPDRSALVDEASDLSAL